MLFNSLEYMAFFLPLVVLLCIALRRWAGPSASQAAVLAASIFFYGWWKPSHLPYLLGSIVLNWLIGRAIHPATQPARKRLLQLGLALNVGFLCLFKYVNFFLGSLSFVFPHGFRLPDLALPLGISFFTLMQIMYLVDVYEDLLPAMNLFDYSTFVSFFPYVISGPLARAKRMRHQFGDFGGRSNITAELFARGLYLFGVGLFKKVLIAESFAHLANAGFTPGANLSALEAWVFSLAYTFQIYFDFSGYTDMAVGSAFMLGIEIPRNFDAPYRAKSITEFWQRWHISLSQFITTYLYTPIMKAMRQRRIFQSALLISAIATLIAMLIAGLWHGPAWTFVAYGAIHGVALAINQYWRKHKMPVLPGWFSWLITFAEVNLALLFFRSHDLHAALHMTASLVNLHHPFSVPVLHSAVAGTLMMNLLMMPVGIVAAFYGPSSDQLAREFRPTFRSAFAIGAMFVASFLFMVFNTSESFVYFQF